MKANKIKTVAVAATFAVLSAFPVFAEKGPKHPQDNFIPRMPVHFFEDQVMGTISSIDREAKVITIIDADGKAKRIHVNPLTTIVRIDPNLELPNSKKNKKDKSDPECPFKVMKIGLENLTKGHWITIQKFKTDTETVEARNISVHNSMEIPLPSDPK